MALNDSVPQHGQSTKAKAFPFLKLPAELRNKIYGLLLAPIHRGYPVDPVTHYVDSITLGNSLVLRQAIRTPLAQSIYGSSHTWTTPPYQAKELLMSNYTWAMRVRIAQATTKQHPSVRETAILHLCKQTHAEGRDVLYSQTTFAVITNLTDPCHHLLKFLPKGIDIGRIQHFRLEIILLLNPSRSRLAYIYAQNVAELFAMMVDLKTLQIVATYEPSLGTGNDYVADWPVVAAPTTNHRQLLKKIAEAIPSRVQKVVWGIPPEDLRYGDFSGYDPVDGEVLEAIVGVGGEG
ncbi:hypothetical protein BU23DRAFT_549818 [Bimuria novae-zelandiae CBS 107.79]|uniref:Uncharacterized protein n=1 Tax=Bimuria novae-zelandiae CBS 107.79 TaxID=1447943 RepID=A0A6A5VZ07_9PLEO|nr:hypothetical protein BU23DRAFT_549818 [Bimuria novae-zelandiae CBS 107.79]